MTRKEVLDAAASCVLKDRQATHGRPENTFDAIAGLWNAYIEALNGVPTILLQAHDVCAMLALLKIGRISQNAGHDDNWVDLAGYAACGSEMMGVPPTSVSLELSSAEQARRETIGCGCVKECSCEAGA